jgi:DNA polymerase III delta prime subunit
MEESVSSLNKLIYNLNRLKVEEAPHIRSIGDFDLLISGLAELNSMVEMDLLKDSVVKQIKFLLVNNNRFQNEDNKFESSAFDGHMLHTVIYGPPGVGKTEVCKILVKIWLGLGIIKRSTSIQSTDDSISTNNTNNITTNNTNNITTFQILSEHIDSLTIGNKIKEDIINRLQSLIADLKDDLSTFDIELEDVQTLLHKFKRKHQLKPVKTYSENNIYDHINRRPEELNDGFEIINKISTEIRKIQQALRKDISNSIPDEKIKFGISIIDFNSAKAPLTKILPPPLNQQPLIPLIPQIPTILSSIEYTDDEEKVDLTNFVKIVSRDDFVAGYLGQSALKTEKLLRESLGKVLFIDEAYSLVNDDKDSYGREAATVLNRFMSEHPQELIVIFAGYKDLMTETIFKYQPGLKSRCTWTFEIDGYTEKGLAEIFKSQINNSGWMIDTTIDLVKFFKKNIKDFQSYGRDTNRLVFYCKICYAEMIFNTNGIHNKLITKNILKSGIEYLKKNRIKDGSENNISHNNMYI